MAKEGTLRRGDFMDGALPKGVPRDNCGVIEPPSEESRRVSSKEEPFDPTLSDFRFSSAGGGCINSPFLLTIRFMFACCQPTLAIYSSGVKVQNA
jgi:hypothetical protein